MRKFVLISLLLGFSVASLWAQVSHGGRPLPLSALRSAEQDWFVEMPSFDLAEQLRIDSLEERDLRSGFHFAYKFMTEYHRDNSGVHFTLPDGTKVWRLGIRSAGARSLNLLFTEYELPEGAQLFLYNADQSQVLGAFNHLNNSERAILPTAPIEGEELIVEYQEPARAAFRGRLVIGEVNHGYRSLRGVEPANPYSSLQCIPSPICYQDSTETYDPTSRSVVLLVINGTLYCTGVLVNNTSHDGTPYLLTASHCLNNNFRLDNPDYAETAGTIVSFFQYESPLCASPLSGTEELSMASARFCAVNETHDMLLLQLEELPPVYYRPYLAGWNRSRIDRAPYACIQHPLGSPKGLALETDTLIYETFDIPEYPFAEKGHLHVSTWEVGCTAAGSSGSPLFDSRQALIGLLSGGQSSCKSPQNDYFYSLGKAWAPADEKDRQLKGWLDAAGTGNSSCMGLDPYADAPCQRSSHVRESGQTDSVEVMLSSQGFPLFGSDGQSDLEFAEAYHSNGPATLYGVYLVTPDLGSQYRNLQVEIQVYAGDRQPTELLHSEPFQPAYCHYNTSDKTFQESTKSLYSAQESFVRFSEPVSVNGDYFISFRVVGETADSYFSVYHLPKGVTTHNTAWIRTGDQWQEATDYPQARFSTSFYIDPVWQYGSWVAVEPVITPSEIRLIQDRTAHLLEIHLPQGETRADFTLTTLSGQICHRQTLQEGQIRIPTHRWPTGLYVVEIRCGTHRLTQKIGL
ncbi:MAG: trypsin-like peptidase domain-containing protein [Parabacteroides sp.]